MKNKIYAIIEMYVGCGGGGWNDVDIYQCFEDEKEAESELENLHKRTDHYNYDWWIKEVELKTKEE